MNDLINFNIGIMQMMKHLRTILLWVFSTVFVVGGLQGVLQANVQKLAEEQQWNTWLTEFISTSEILHYWGLFLMGVSLGIILLLCISKKYPFLLTAWTENARLTLTFDAALTNASPTYQEAVRYYYWYHFPGVAVDYTNQTTIPTIGYVMIYLSLADPTYTNYSQIRVIGGGIPCEILAHHASGAIIRVMGDMRGRSIDIRFSKMPIPLN